MADHRIYVRFVDPQGTYFGKSTYRPSEGWIDGLSYNFGILGQPEFYVIIGGNDAPSIPLYRAFQNRTPIDYAVVEVRGAKWSRFEMTDVLIEGFGTNHRAGSDGPEHQIRFTYKTRKDSSGKGP